MIVLCFSISQTVNNLTVSEEVLFHFFIQFITYYYYFHFVRISNKVSKHKILFVIYY